LKGHVQDTNSHYLCKELWQLGAKVSKIVVVRDDMEDIASVVRETSPNFDVVITTGGVGPTHDDITLEGNYAEEQMFKFYVYLEIQGMGTIIIIHLYYVWASVCQNNSTGTY